MKVARSSASYHRKLRKLNIFRSLLLPDLNPSFGMTTATIPTVNGTCVDAGVTDNTEKINVTK